MCRTALALVLALATVACGTERPDLIDPGVPREVDSTTTTTTTIELSERPVVRLAVDGWTGDPADAGPADLGRRVVADLLYEGLTRVDSEGTVGPALAESWSVTPDRLTWVFAISPDAVDSAGERVTARTAMRSLDRVAARGPDDVLAPVLGAVSGWSDRMSGRAGGVAGMSAPTPDQLVIRLDRPFEPLAEVLAWPAFGITGGEPGRFASTGGYRVDEESGTLRPVTESSLLPDVRIVATAPEDGPALVASGDVDWAVLPRGAAMDGMPGDAVRVPVGVRIGIAIRHHEASTRRAINQALDSVALATALGLVPSPPRVSNGAIGDLPRDMTVDVPDGSLSALGPELVDQLTKAGVDVDLIVSDADTFAARVVTREARVHPIVLPGGPWSGEWVAGSLVPGAANDLIDVESFERSSLGESLTSTRDREDRDLFTDLLVQTAVDEGVLVLLGELEFNVATNREVWPLRHRADGTLELGP